MLRLPAASRWLPCAEAVRDARRFVEAHLGAAGLAELAEDAGLATSELAANAVLHARTPFVVAVSATGGGARVEVRDDSPRLPLVAPPDAAATAMSGRGLLMVAALAARWGADPGQPGDAAGSAGSGAGKVVWFEVEPGGCASDAGPSAEDLLAMWADVDEPPTVVVPDVPVGTALAVEERVDDLLREVQLIVLAPGAAALPDGAAGEALRSARRIDAAVQGFGDVRAQVRAQVVRAAREGRAAVALRLVLGPGDAARTAAYRDALDDAERLAGRGLLLAGADATAEDAALRRWLLDRVVAQLAG